MVQIGASEAQGALAPHRGDPRMGEPRSSPHSEQVDSRAVMKTFISLSSVFMATLMVLPFFVGCCNQNRCRAGRPRDAGLRAP